ncbi:GNAT family N-acetyltransferase [Alphaproteobacteria bacterium AO1-B]|nr:GNAT family N-acetyltransferase [Alphaproteobacteria bacterium AO1-B]
MSPANISFVCLTSISLAELTAHMNDPRLAAHMPLLTKAWDDETAAQFIAAKEACWQRDGLGHWAFLNHGRYAGWGGFQKEGDEWDFGLVLKPDCFGLGISITRKALAFAQADDRIPFVTFLLPPSRKKLGALKRMGARFIADVDYGGEIFGKYQLATGLSA